MMMMMMMMMMSDDDDHESCDTTLHMGAKCVIRSLHRYKMVFGSGSKYNNLMFIVYPNMMVAVLLVIHNCSSQI